MIVKEVSILSQNNYSSLLLYNFFVTILNFFFALNKILKKMLYLIFKYKNIANFRNSFCQNIIFKRTRNFIGIKLSLFLSFNNINI